MYLFVYWHLETPIGLFSNNIFMQNYGKRKQEINEPDTSNSRRKQKQISVAYIRFKEARH
jgi:hypothetical protein